MSKTTPTPPSAKGGSSAAKKRIAEQRAAQAAAKKAQDRRRRVVVVVSVTVVVALIAVGAFALVGITGKGAASASSGASSLSAQVVRDVTGVPESALDQVGVGTVSAVPASLPGPALTANGKPQILYIGAEYCPYCATERWPVVVALSRFGHFSNLGATASTSTDVYPDTQTLSFHGASYTSSTLDFVGKEIEDTQGKPLDQLTSAEQSLMNKYDAPPYVPSASGDPIPFIDIGGRYVISGAEYNPQILQGKSRTQIAAALSDPSSPIAKGVDGTANVITAAICKVTAGAPASVCTAPGVVAAAKTLK